MYQRYLQNEDYQSLISDRFLDQVTDGFTEVIFEKREQHAEVSVVEYLQDNYNIEKELALGKSIADFSALINYPKGAFIKYNDEIIEILQSIRGITTPDNKVYWELVDEDKLTRSEKLEFIPYTQLLDWNEGDGVVYQEQYFKCILYNGLSYENIHIPNEEIYWKLLPTDTLTDYEEDNIEDYDMTVDDYVAGDRVCFDEVFYECLSDKVNHQLPEHRKNYRVRDPRNASIVRCLSMIALFNMHKSISPNDIPNLRIADFEMAMKDLSNYNKLKLNPGLERRESSNGGVSVDWAFGTFGNNYTDNPWYT